MSPQFTRYAPCLCAGCLLNVYTTLLEQVYRKVALKLVKGGGITIEKIPVEAAVPATESAASGAAEEKASTEETAPGGAAEEKAAEGAAEASSGTETSKEAPAEASEAANARGPNGGSGDAAKATATPLQQQKVRAWDQCSPVVLLWIVNPTPGDRSPSLTALQVTDTGEPPPLL